ncbi:hypothetical protein AALO_G00025120, partial [Alosa alosa]
AAWYAALTRGDGLDPKPAPVEEEQPDEVVEDDGPILPHWRTLYNPNPIAYPKWQGNLPRPNDLMSPLEVFFSEDILDVIVDQSNLYAMQCDPNKPLNLKTSELEQFLGTVLYMSLFGLPGTRMYWSKSSRVSQVVDTMSLNRWEIIKKFLHFSNNNRQNEDPLYKVRPLVDHLTSKLMSIPMVEKLAVDEQMVPFKGNSKLKQYLPKKNKEVGLQNFCFSWF